MPLTPEEIEEIEHEIAIVPHKASACIEAMKAVQRRRGWVSDEALKDIAAYLEMSPEDLEGVATFYNLIFRRPVGRHVIFVCDSVSCWILGVDRVRERLTHKLGIQFGETTADGRFTMLPIQCLGTCDRAPALMIDNDLHRDLKPEQVDVMLDGYE